MTQTTQSKIRELLIKFVCKNTDNQYYSDGCCVGLDTALSAIIACVVEDVEKMRKPITQAFDDFDNGEVRTNE